MKTRLRTVRAALLLAVLPGLLGVALAHWPPAESLERMGLDGLFLLRGPLPEPERVAVVAIDGDSYSVLGVDPAGAWPRRLHADLIRTLAREGARAVAFDVVFEDAGDPEQDAALEGAIREAGNVVLGATIEQVADPRFRQMRRIEPYEPFRTAAAAAADVNLPLDRDGVVRSAWLTPAGSPGLALAAYETATGDRTKREIDARFVNYYGPPRTIRTVSVYQALDPAQYLSPGFFRDKVVFVGLSQPAAAGPAAKDAFPTPFRAAGGEQTYGVEIHATIAANLLDGTRISLLPGPLEAALLLSLPLLATLACMALGPLLGGVALVLLAFAPWLAGYAAFDRGGLWLPVIIPSAVQLPAAYLSSLLWYYLTTVRDRERIRRAFSFYLSPEMIAKIALDPDSLNLGGEEIVGTALMTDIQGFTGIAETLGAPETARMLNAYFSDVTTHIFEVGGTLIKFIGDAVFAIWGAPVRVEDHAARACRAALSLARSQEAAPGGPAPRLVTRVGIHTGPMVVGNLGSWQRFDYTAIGDAVNLASRLEGLCKPFGARVVASAATLAAAGSGFVTRPLGVVRVVGRSEPVAIHELLASPGEPSPIALPLLEEFRDALEAFREGRFSDASRGFRAVADGREAGDGPSRFYLATIERLAAEPPGPGWDGVVGFETK